MATQGYTYALVMLTGSGPFVFCKYYDTDEQAIDEAKALIEKDDDIDYILLRKGDTSAEDPVIWDSRVTEKVVERDINGEEVNTNELNELWGSDPNCIHDIKYAPFGGGVKCVKCGGWFCY